MLVISRLIFGKNVAFHVTEPLVELLLGSLEGYPDVQSDRAPDISIRFGEVGTTEPLLSRNPSTFQRFERFVITDFPHGRISWKPSVTDRALSIKVDFALRSLRMTYRQKFRSLEYSSEVEAFEQLLHELVLVPSMYFFSDRAVIHAAAVSVDGKAVLLTGTGGTGKTSGLLSMRHADGVEFLADDIGVLAADGIVFPNLAWPKIYGYNLGVHVKKEELLSGRSFADRLHFNMRYKVNPARVRRKLTAQKLFGSVSPKPVPLNTALFLFRQNIKQMVVEDLPTSLAVEMSLAVMRTEYDHLHRFFFWDCYNSLALGRSPLLNLEDVMNNWRQTLTRIYSNASVKIVRIPSGIGHDEYLAGIREIVITENQ
jgi:hypothetical protein